MDDIPLGDSTLDGIQKRKCSIFRKTIKLNAIDDSPANPAIGFTACIKGAEKCTNCQPLGKKIIEPDISATSGTEIIQSTQNNNMEPTDSKINRPTIMKTTEKEKKSKSGPKRRVSLDTTLKNDGIKGEKNKNKNNHKSKNKEEINENLIHNKINADTNPSENTIGTTNNVNGHIPNTDNNSVSAYFYHDHGVQLAFFKNVANVTTKR